MMVGDEDYLRIDYEGTANDWHMWPVEPKHVAQFPTEWALYEKTRPSKLLDGTSISKLPGLLNDIEAVTMLTRKGVGTIEIMAGLDDRSSIFLDEKRGITWRDTAKMFVEKARLEDAATGSKGNTLRAPDQNQQRKAA
jgi:hypothetical protein